MVEPLSPLGDAWQPGTYGNLQSGAGVVLSETRPGSIVEASAWNGQVPGLIATIAQVTGLALDAAQGSGNVGGDFSAFGIGPARFLVVANDAGLAQRLGNAVPIDTGTVTDLSHGRTAFCLEGPRAEWVLSKLFALDFAPAAFPVNAGRATVHHDILAQIQRTGPDQFDVYIFRSFARSFWKMLCDASEEVGYEER